MAATAEAIAGAAKIRDKELADVDKRETESFDKLLQKYETYEQGRLRIAEKYDKEIAELAGHPENQAIAERAKQKALDDFAVQFAGQFPQFEAWADTIVSASVENLTDLLIEVQEELDNLQSETPDAGDAIAVARAKIIELERQIAKLSNKQQTKSTDTTDWTELHRVLSDVVQTFNEVGDAIGGTGGKIVSVTGNIAGSTLQFVNAIKAYKEASSNDKIGMASGVLGAVSAGISAISTIVELFGNGETSLERNLRLAREFNEELRIMKERSKIDSDTFDTIFGERLFARYAQNVDVARAALERFRQTQEEVRLRGEELTVGVMDKRMATTGLSGLALFEKSWTSAIESIANMQVQTRHSTWFRSAKYASLGSLLPELFSGGELDMDALRTFVDEGGETFQHLSYENQQMLRRMADDWETYEEALASIKDYLTNIFGELGGTLTDALVDAFENGTNAANTFVDSVGQALRNLAKDMAYSVTLGPVFEAAQQRMNAIAESAESDEERFSQWSQALGQMVSEALGKQSEFNRLWEEFRRIAAENGLSIDSIEGTAQSGRTGAIQTVTQESFSRVEGLVTSIQIHAANMDDGLEGITSTLGASLDALNKIAKNTDHLPSILALLQEVKRDGLKVI